MSENANNSDDNYTPNMYTPYDPAAPKVPVNTAAPTLVAVPNNLKGLSFLNRGLAGLDAPPVDMSYAEHLGTTVATAAKLDGGCAGIRRPFVKASMEASDCFLYYTSNSVILGFVTVLVGTDDPPRNGSAGKSVEIDLLCANKRYSGVGSKLIDAVNRVAKAAGYATLRLKSVRSARNFYGSRGFTPNGVDDAEGLVRMTRAVTRRCRGRGRGTRRR